MENNIKVKSLAKSATLLSATSLIALLFSFVKESVLAFCFGTSFEMDAYAMAVQLPVTLFSVVSVSLSTTVIPNYSKELYKKGLKNANRYASNLMTLFISFTVVLVIVLVVFSDFVVTIIAPGATAESKVLISSIFRIVLPTVICTEMINISTGIMNVHHSYIPPAACPIVLNIGFIFTLILFYNNLGIYAAVYGTVIGSIMELVFLTLFRRRFMKYKFTFDIKDESTRNSIKMSGPVFLGTGAAEVNKVIDRVVASFLTTGSISSLDYAGKLTSAISAIMIKTITTITFPEFAKAAANNDKRKLASNFILSTKIYIFVLIPVISGGIYLSNFIVRIVFMRGSFDFDSLFATAPLFSCYLVGFFFTTLRQSASNYFYSLGNTKTPMLNSVLGVCVNVILNLLLYQKLQAFGLALATATSAFVISILLLISIKKNNEYIEFKSCIFSLIKCILSAGVMIFILVIINMFIFRIDIVSISTIYSIVFLISNVLLGSIIYLIFAIVFKIDEVKYFQSFLKRKK